MAPRVSDTGLLRALAQIPNPKDRAYLVSHLHPDCIASLCQHLKGFIDQKTHILPEGQDKLRVRKALEPHKQILHRVISKSLKKKLKRPLNLRTQKGGAIFSTIVAAVAPLLISLISKALSKKKSK